MLDFDYYRPQTMDELASLLERTGGKLVAGGTDLLPRMRHRHQAWPCLLDISRVEGLRFCRQTEGRIHIGALTTHADLMESSLLQTWAPALAAAAASVGCPQTRQRGTLGGNLSNASPAGDTAPPLLALGAEATLASLQGQRQVALRDFFTGPGRTCMVPGEYLQSVSFPCPTGTWGASFQKLGRRKGMAISVVSAAAYLELDGQGRIKAARVALGSVAPCPVRSPHAETVLLDQLADGALFRRAGQGALTDLSPVDDVRATGSYRRLAAAVVTERALSQAWEQAQGRLS